MISITDNRRKRLFASVMAGEFFLHNGSLYQRTRWSQGELTINAVHIETGTHTRIEATDAVEPVSVEITIKE